MKLSEHQTEIAGLRLRCLELATPYQIGNPDVEKILMRADRYFAYCMAGGLVENKNRRARKSTANTTGGATAKQAN